MNVAHKLEEKLPAEAIQCSPSDDQETLKCMATNNASNRKYFEKDWEIEVDEIVGYGTDIMSHNQFINTTSIKPAGGPKECMPILGNGAGNVTLVCKEEGETFSREKRRSKNRPDNFKQKLQERNLNYTKTNTDNRTSDYRR